MSLAGTIKPGDWRSVRQAIHKLSYLELGPTAAPTFEGLTLTGLTASRLVATDADKEFVSSDLYSWVTQTTNQVLIADDGDGTVTFSTPQDIHTGAIPTFAGIRLGSVGDGSPIIAYGQTIEFSNIGSVHPIEVWLKAPTGKESIIYFYPDTGGVSANRWRIYVPDYETADFAIQNYYGSSWTSKLSINAATGDITIQGELSVDDIDITNYIKSNLIPSVTDVKDLGSSSKKWRDLYLSGNLTDGTNSLTIANAKTAYDHSQDNSRAHSDYLINTGDDSTSGILTAAGFTTVGTVTADDYVLAITDSDSGQIIQGGNRILHTYVPSDQSPTWANIFIGENAGNFTITNPTLAYEGTGNIGIGEDTLDALTTGYYNFAMGTNSGTDLTSGYNNVLIGHQAGGNITDGDDNFLFGRDCGAFVQTGYRNVGIGTNALRGSTPASAGMKQNVAIGYKSGYGLTGDSNIFIGLYSGYRQTAVNGRLIIDNALRADAATEATNAIIYGTMAALPANQILKVNAVLNVTENIQIDGIRVITNQQVHIADAPGDTAANNAITINAILVALETHGLLAAA